MLLSSKPTPYFETEGVTLYCGDGRKIAPSLEPVDMILIDPPYGETVYDWDKWPKGWVAVARRALNRTGSMWCTGSFRTFYDNRDEFRENFHLSQDIIWEKHNGSNARNDRFRRVHELAVHFWPRDVAWGDVYKKPVLVYTAEKRRVKKQQKPDHWRSMGKAPVYETEEGGPVLMKSVIWARSMAGKTSVTWKGDKNATQKPFDLLAPLIEYSCPPGGTILDMTCGSGSTLALALKMGRRAIGIDIREGQCELARQRIFGGPLFMEWEAENEPPMSEEEIEDMWGAQVTIGEQLSMFAEAE